MKKLDQQGVHVPIETTDDLQPEPRDPMTATASGDNGPASASRTVTKLVGDTVEIPIKGWDRSRFRVQR